MERTLKNTVSVVVVTYNSSALIGECLKSLSSCQEIKEIIVIDNASPDQAVSRVVITDNFSGVKFVANQKNIGYGAAVNQGARIAKGEHLFFMNPDVIVPHGTIEKLVAFMESHPDCGACSPYIQTPTKPWWYSWIVLRMPVAFARSSKKSPYKVKFLLACATLVKRDFFLQLGGFDERFFLYYEDRDLGYRIREKGKFNYVVPSSSVIHFYGKSSATIPIEEKGKILTESRWYFAKKHNLRGLKLWSKIYSPIQKVLCWLASWL